MWCLSKCTLFIWSLESRGIRSMMEIPSCSSNSHPAPPLLRLRVLLSRLIDSSYFHSRNPSAAYQHSSLSQGHCLFSYPWSWIPGLYSHSAMWICVFAQPPVSKESRLSGKAAFTPPTQKSIKHRKELFVTTTLTLIPLCVLQAVWPCNLIVPSFCASSDFKHCKMNKTVFSFLRISFNDITSKALDILKETLQNMYITQVNVFMCVRVCLSSFLLLWYYIIGCLRFHPGALPVSTTPLIISYTRNGYCNWGRTRKLKVNFSSHNVFLMIRMNQKELRRTHHSVVWFCCNVIIICSISRQMLETVPGNIVQIFMVARWRIPLTLGMLWIFIYFHHHSRFSVCPAVQIYDQMLAKLTAWQSNCTFCLRFITRC